MSCLAHFLCFCITYSGTEPIGSVVVGLVRFELTASTLGEWRSIQIELEVVGAPGTYQGNRVQVWRGFPLPHG